MSSARHGPALRVAIKDMGDASRALQAAPVGGKALVEGPYGDFFPANGSAARELWIAGGIGLTPFLSRARALTGAKPADIQLIYCVQDETRAHFFPELEAIAARAAGFRLAMHYFGREGPLNSAFIAFLASAATIGLLAVLVPEPRRPAAEAERGIPREELARHSSAADCWLAVSGGVYDVSGYVPVHPAPRGVLIAWCGKEATEAFNTKGHGRPHGAQARALPARLRLGKLL